jgi:hypothetical protein
MREVEITVEATNFASLSADEIQLPWENGMLIWLDEGNRATLESIQA